MKKTLLNAAKCLVKFAVLTALVSALTYVFTRQLTDYQECW